MEQFKIDIYKKETGKDFINSVSLSENERVILVKEILHLLEINDLNIELFRAVQSKLNFRDFNENFTFDLKEIMKQFSLLPKDEVLVVWDKNHIDQIEYRFLLDNWKYIWYGSSDEAVILFFKNQRRLLLLNHYGRIFFN